MDKTRLGDFVWRSGANHPTGDSHRKPKTLRKRGVTCASDPEALQEEAPLKKGNPPWMEGNGMKREFPRKAAVCESNVTALWREVALLVPGYEYFSAIPQSRQAMSTALYRYTGNVLLRPPYWGTPTVDGSERKLNGKKM